MRADQMRFYNRICKYKIAAFILHLCASEVTLKKKTKPTLEKKKPIINNILNLI